MHTYIDKDYNGEMITVDIPAGVLSQSFMINITDDDVVECNETFSLAIVSMFPCEVVTGNFNISKVIIIDTDGE